MKNILISNPGYFYKNVYLPYVWGVLKVYCEQIPEIKSKFNWLPPIFRPRPVDEMVKEYQDTKIDILGLSCYIWNFDSNISLAKKLKLLNPKMIVVAGGPHINWDSMDEFLSEHPFIDFVISYEGEEAFRQILSQIEQPEPQFAHIKGLFSRVFPYAGHPAPTIQKSVSPYLENSDAYKKIIFSIKKELGEVFVLFETDRGCPYGCCFCNWGSSTMSKTRHICMDRLFAEIEWFGENEINAIEIVNANFGMFQNDLAIAEKIASVKKKYGYPKSVWYSSSKNNPDRVLEIVKIFKQSELIDYQLLAMQTMTTQVLKNIKRGNMSADQMKEFVKSCKEIGVPVKPQLIRGLPGETVESWLTSLANILELGEINELNNFQWEVLPNSPSDKKEFRELWGIQTVNRYTHSLRRNKKANVSTSSITEVVVSTSTYSVNQFVEMWFLTIIVETFFAQGFAKFILIYLRHEYEISYKKLILDLYQFLQNSENNEIYLWSKELQKYLAKYSDKNVAASDALLE
jgi:putative methyltransferase